MEMNMELNGTKVILEEIDGKTVVQVNTSDADVLVNGTLFWTKYNKEEYKDIPPQLRSFVEKRQDFLGKNEKDELTAYLYTEGLRSCATLYVPKNWKKKFVFRMDFIFNMNNLEHEFVRNHRFVSDARKDEVMVEFNRLFKQIEQAVKDAGYLFAPSHSRDFIYGWWDVSFELEKWDENKFLTIWERIDQFMEFLLEIGMDFYAS